MATAVAQKASRLHFQLPPLPYAEDALAPVISAETLKLHHGKHHKKYVDTMNQLLEKEKPGGNAAASTLEEVVRQSKGKLFNNAAQAWNHDFYWHSLSPRRQRPHGAMLQRLEKDFGNYDKWADQFSQAAIGQFGSGWAWLVEKDGRLQVMTTSNAETPMAQGIRCLLTVDVWEHAYYVDYRNERDRYVSAILDRLNWAFAEKNLG